MSGLRLEDARQAGSHQAGRIQVLVSDSETDGCQHRAMQLTEKLGILADAAKYDASCSSSGGAKRDSRSSGGSIAYDVKNKALSV